MKNKTNLLRISYWAGAIIDALAAIAMLVPTVGRAAFGLQAFTPGVEYTFAMRMGGSLMLGWTALLLWADRDPLPRKFILLLTIFPVLSGIILAEVLAVQAGMFALERMLPLFVLQGILVGLFLYSYWKNRT